MTKYIGARYVPLIVGEWSKENEYEPITVVTHQGSSYTSKSFVPKGIEITDSKYWVLTGNYNAQIDMYRAETAVAKELAEQAIVNSENILTIKNIRNRKFLFIGDSYGNSDVNWVSTFTTILGINDADYVNMSESGAGFIPSDYMYITQINNYDGVINAEDITDIIICGGYNDARSEFEPNQDKIVQALYEVDSAIRAKFYNATIYLGMIGNSSSGGEYGANMRRNIANYVLPSYKRCLERGWFYLNGVENVMHNYYDCFRDDNVHPTEFGSLKLGQSIAEAWRTGSCEIFYALTSVNKLSAGYSSNLTPFYSFLKNDIITIACNNPTISMESPISMNPSDTAIKVFEKVSNYVLGSSEGATGLLDCVNISAKLYNGSNVLKTCPCNLYIDRDGAGWLHFLIDTPLENITRFKLYNAQGYLPTQFH